MPSIAALLGGCASAPPKPEPALVTRTNVDYHAVMAADTKRFSRWQDEYDTHGNSIGSQQVVVAAKPFSLDYAFNFALRDGEPFVGTQTTQPK